ncbi:MAG: glycosyltransferase family 4 protein [Candidatus Lokiarchaeota archaeon]|nr:glycosyltransferase family 4 protein [Candidatus Lokiarchaeota archaeon]
MKTILYLPTRYFPAISGAELYIQRLAEIFKKDFKCDVDIFTSNALDFKALRDPKGKIVKETNKYFSNVNNVDVYRFPVSYKEEPGESLQELKKIPILESLQIPDEILSQLLKNGPYLKEMIDRFLNYKQKDYDIIHTTFFPYFNLIIALLIGKILKKPVICTPFFHFSNPRYLNSNVITILRNFDMLIACTSIEKDYLINNLNLTESKITTIPMGVDFDKFTILKGIFNFKDHYFMRKERNYKLVLFCGYKNFEKGAISILKAIPLILEKYPKVYFTFIGPSTTAFNREIVKTKKNTKTRIINLTPDNLTGYFDKNKITAFMESDIYLMPSRSDAYGIAFLEAWSAGKPVIGAKIGATPEVIQDNINGLLVEFDNPHNIADQVVKLLRNKKLRKRLGEQGKAKVETFHSWRNIANMTKKVYDNLINTRSDRN